MVSAGLVLSDGDNKYVKRKKEREIEIRFWEGRTGLTGLDITLITPPASKAPLEAALSQNPHLTSLPSPSASVLAPAELSLTTGTAELLRLPEVQSCIKSDFVLLPCDLICDIPGESLLEAWMVSQSALGGSTVRDGRNTHGPRSAGMGGEQGGRRGGLGVYYQTRDREESVKGEVTDFVATAPLEQDEAPAVCHPIDGPASIRFGLSRLVLSMPMDTLKEKMEEDKGLLIRHSLVKKHAQVKMLTSYRDAHIYVLPYWVKDMARLNEKFENVSEDLVGWWAKSGWQAGLGEKLHLREIFEPERQQEGDTVDNDGESLEEEIDLKAMSTTKSGAGTSSDAITNTNTTTTAEFTPPPGLPRTTSSLEAAAAAAKRSSKPLTVPPMLAYVHSSMPSAPLVRRVDNAAILLSTSLRLAKLESVEETGRAAASPFAHNHKIAYAGGIAQRCTVTKADCLLAENVTVEEKCVVKESVIGANCRIASGARLTRCLVMDGAVVGERCQLTGCIIGRRSKIGRESSLKDCEVQDGNVVEDETDAKNEKFMVFEGFDDDGDDDDDDAEGMDVSEDFDAGKDE